MGVLSIDNSSKSPILVIMSQPLVSTADAARAVGVGLSTVKRWADAGLLQCVKTPGGHRRYALADVEVLVRGEAAAPDERAPLAFVNLLLGGSGHEIEAHLMQARGRLGAWHRVADSLGAVIEEIGRLWHERRLSVLEEHLASERLARALGRIGEAMPTTGYAPRALLCCADGDEHTLGLSLVELTLREAGWQPLWAGRRTPTAEVVRQVKKGEVDLVALSASSYSADATALAADVPAWRAPAAPPGRRSCSGAPAPGPRRPPGRCACAASRSSPRSPES